VVNVFRGSPVILDLSCGGSQTTGLQYLRIFAHWQEDNGNGYHEFCVNHCVVIHIRRDAIPQPVVGREPSSEKGNYHMNMESLYCMNLLLLVQSRFKSFALVLIRFLQSRSKLPNPISGSSKIDEAFRQIFLRLLVERECINFSSIFAVPVAKGLLDDGIGKKK
jgi:hypothetical protein